MKFRFTPFPKTALGPFKIGSTLKAVVEFLELHSKDFMSIQMVFNADEPFSSQLEIYILDQGIRLRFNAKSQELTHIDIFNSNFVEIKYEKGILCSPSSPANFASVYSLLGPTHAGTMNVDFGFYELDYPGVTFSFPIPDDYHDLYVESDSPQIPIELPDGTTPTASQITIHKSNLTQYHLGTPGESENKAKDIEFDLIADVKGIHFEETERELLFKSKPQDAVMILGQYSEIYRKEPSISIHKMAKEYVSTEMREITSENGENEDEDSSEDLEDYVMNYFEKGIDLVYNPRTHQLKAFALHTNLPGHYLFPNRYARCRYKLNVYDKFELQYTTKFPDIKKNFESSPRPLVLNLAKTSDSRFSCFLHSFNRIFFEVTRQGYISRVTVHDEV